MLEPSVRAAYASQPEVLACFDSLADGTAKELLAASLAAIDVADMLKVHARVAQAAREASLASSHDSAVAMGRLIEPLPQITRLGATDPTDVRAWRTRGLELVRRGAVGVVLLSGGQGTRLGSSLPKGLYELQLPSRKCLLELQAERLQRLRLLAAAGAGNVPAVPWFIMTSPATDDATRQFFDERDFFGLPRDCVHFFVQEEMPCMTPDGHFIMASRDRLSTAPNGNGGLYEALSRSGSLARMRALGVEHVFVYGVDNVLCKVADPVFVGWFDSQDGAPECGCKVVPKRNAQEPVGVVCCRDGRPGVLEYSELPRELSEATAPDGSLLLNAGNIATHIFRLSFLERIVAQPLPYHMAKKRTAAYELATDRIVVPDLPNCWKFEMFIFDVFPFANRLVALEVDRAAEFSPLKNAPGASDDSPETCRAHLSALHRRYLADAGAVVVGDGLVEIAPLLTYDGEGLEAVRGATLHAPLYLSSLPR